MFLFRTTLLLGLSVLVLPTDPASQANVFASAKVATQWTVTFCDRNPQTCVQGQQVWAVFVQKAQFGAKMAYELISEHGSPATATPPAPAKQPARQAAGVPARGTLLPADLAPGWREPTRRAGS